MGYKGRKLQIVYKCENCGSDHAAIGKSTRGPYEQWIFRRDENKQVFGMYCYDCAQRLIYSPRRDRKYGNSKRFYFAHKVVYGWAPLRRGIAQNAPIISLISSKKTHLHHDFYITCMPWVGVEEVCVQCHNKTRRV